MEHKSTNLSKKREKLLRQSKRPLIAKTIWGIIENFGQNKKSEILN